MQCTKSLRECASNKTSGATTQSTCPITRLKEEALTGLRSRAFCQEILGQVDLLRLINCDSRWFLMNLDSIATTLTISYLKCKFSSSNNHSHLNNCSKLRTSPAKIWLRQCLANPNPSTSKSPSQITTVIRLLCVRSSQARQLLKTPHMLITVTTRCPSRECRKWKLTTKTCSHLSTSPKTTTPQTQPQSWTNNPTSKDSSETQSLFQTNKKNSQLRFRAKRM